MGQFLPQYIPREPLFSIKLNSFDWPKLKNFTSSWLAGDSFARSLKCQGVQSSIQGAFKVDNHVETPFNYEEFDCIVEESEALPYVQTLRNFPKKNLFEKVVLVRFDSSILLIAEADQIIQSASDALFTIKYLNEARSKVILVGDWNAKKDPKHVTLESIADLLTSTLNIKVVTIKGISLGGLSKTKYFEMSDILLLDNLSKFKEDVSNCPKFAETLSSGVDIFVNDLFSHSHKILSSNVGITRFCDSCLAGFHFERSLNRLRSIGKIERKPYVAIIGGGKILDKTVALQSLASKCDEIVFFGAICFQIMHALGLSVPLNLVERGDIKAASEIVQFTQSRNVNLVYPKDFLCKNESLPKEFKILPSDGIIDGWIPVDVGPESLDKIMSLLMKCKKILWIGPLKFHKSSDLSRESELSRTLNQLCQSDRCITFVGTKACKALMKDSSYVYHVNMLNDASVVWEFLKGRKLPGVQALDRAYPFDINWKSVYLDPSKPLIVDIGSGNGVFLLGMAKRRKDSNYLGLEINKKLVRRCLDSVQRFGITNGHFIAANATSMFHSIISSYPGELVLVSIQCPNPDFNNPENRWRMLQRSLVKAIIELLSANGKVFLQSDVEAVSLRMKQEFLKYGNGKLVLHEENNNIVTCQGWLKDNPFGVRSDWEQHVLDRGSPMYRLMLSKLLD